jgi:hypothetical protein
MPALTYRRAYSRLVHHWVKSIGLEAASYGTHSMRRTKAAQIYRKTGNLRAVQLLLGHTKLESTVRYLGIEIDDALSMAANTPLILSTTSRRRSLRARSCRLREQLLHTPKSAMERCGPSAAQVAREDELHDHLRRGPSNNNWHWLKSHSIPFC